MNPDTIIIVFPFLRLKLHCDIQVESWGYAMLLQNNAHVSNIIHNTMKSYLKPLSTNLIYYTSVVVIWMQCWIDRWISIHYQVYCTPVIYSTKSTYPFNIVYCKYWCGRGENMQSLIISGDICDLL